MEGTPESRADSALAEVTADACRRIAAGLLDHTGDDLREFLVNEVEGLRGVLRDPARLDLIEDPADPPTFSRKGYVVVNTNPVTSRRNPLAPPLTGKSDGDRFVATIQPLPVQYQGPRGRLHGGYVGMLLDQVMWSAVYERLRHTSFTRTLNITYEQAAPIGAELTAIGRVTEVEGRKTYAEGELRAGDVVCARAEGLWISPRPRA